MATGRLGYAVDGFFGLNHLLMYAKGGAAFVPTKASVTDLCTATGCGNWLLATLASDTFTTWTVGGGFEWAVTNNWSVKAEYMYIALGDKSLSSCGVAQLATGAFVPGGAFCFRHDLPNLHTVKIGVNYRLGALLPALGL